MTGGDDTVRTPPTRRLEGIRLALIEDHVLLAESLRLSLGAEGAHIRAVRLDDVESIIEECRQHQPDVVLLDLDLGPALGDGAALIAPLAQSNMHVLLLTGCVDRARLGSCLEAGAVGVIPKAEKLDALIEQVRLAACGERVLTADRRLELLLESWHERVLRHDQLAPFEALTERERDVLGELMQGRRVDGISRELFLSEATVRTHVRGILLKLGVQSQLAAVVRAREAGWQPMARRKTAS